MHPLVQYARNTYERIGDDDGQQPEEDDSRVYHFQTEESFWICSGEKDVDNWREDEYPRGTA